MENEINNKMAKRLKWLSPNEDRQSTWLAKHLIKNPLTWDNQFATMLTPSNSYNSDEEFAMAFLDCAYHWPESASTREICRNLKAAWKSWDKRDKNKDNKSFAEGSYTISIKAKAELERLAKSMTTKSLSSVIDTLLLDAVSIKELQKKLSKRVNQTNYKIRLNSDFFSTFFSDDKVNEQAIIITQMLKQDLGFKEKELKNEKIKSTNLEGENSKSKTEIDRMREKIVSLEEENSKLKKSEEAANKELDDFLES